MRGALLLVGLLAMSPAAAGAEQIESLDWLAGCWTFVRGGELSEECWLAPRAGAMVGVNRSSAGDRYAFEFLRIVEDEGDVVFLASPSGREPVAFRASSIADRRVVFENPEHDFPQRITYWLEEERLHARVEAEKDGKMDGFELVWERSPGGWSGPSEASDE